MSVKTPKAPGLPGAFGRAREGSGVAENGLDLELDGDLVTDDDAAAVHRHLDVDAELVAVDLGLGGEAGARAAEGVRAEAVELKVEDDRAGDALDRQLALDGPVGAVGLHRGGAEEHGRVVLDVEEVSRADVRVALLLTGVDGAELDTGLDRGLGGVLGGDDLALEVAEVAADLADHHVADGEADGRVRRVDLPGADDVAGDLDGGGAGHSGCLRSS